MSRFTTNVALLANAAATGARVPVAYGGRFLLLACGTFGGATVKLQILGPDDVTMLDVPDSSMTAVGAEVVFLPDNAVVMAHVASGAPAALYVSLRRCPEAP